MPTKQELREPSLLSDNPFHTDSAHKAYEQGKRDQREADIKWMKKNCYLKAKRELEEIGDTKCEGQCNITCHNIERKLTQEAMLGEVKGVSFKAVGKWN